MGKVNENLRRYKEHQRNETLATIDKTIIDLKNCGRSVTISNIADEMGSSRQRMYATYIQNHLLKYPEFNPKLQRAIQLEQSEAGSEVNMARLINENAKLQDEVNKLRKQKHNTEEKCKSLKSKYDELHYEVKKLRDELYKAQKGKVIQM